MRFGRLHFGSITINGVKYTRDVVIDRGRVGKRKKKPSQKFVSSSDILPCQSRRNCHGNAGGS